MLPHPTYDRLIALGLVGMAKAFEEQRQQPAAASLMFEERIGLLVDREAVERESRRLVTRLKFANLRQNATIEDLNTRAARGLDKALFAKLATGDWIGRRHDLLITGKTGTGKSWLACALGHKACRDDRSVLYYRVPRLLDASALARGDGRHPALGQELTPSPTARRAQAGIGVRARSAEPRPCRASDPRRLGAGTADFAAGPRPARNRR